MDDPRIKQKEVEEPKMDTGEPVTGACLAWYSFRTLSLVVSLAPSLRVPDVLHALRAVPLHFPGDCPHVLDVLRVLHSY